MILAICFFSAILLINLGISIKFIFLQEEWASGLIDFSLLLFHFQWFQFFLYNFLFLLTRALICSCCLTSYSRTLSHWFLEPSFQLKRKNHFSLLTLSWQQMCGFSLQEFSNFPDTTWMSYNSVLTLTAWGQHRPHRLERDSAP